MKRTLCFFIFWWIGIFALTAQSGIIQGNIENAEAGHVRLASYYGDRFTVIDSMETSTGFFYFVLPEDAGPGIYRLIFAERRGEVLRQNSMAEFIYNKENLEIYVTSSEGGPVPYFENSEENQVYREFMDFELAYEAELMDLYGKLSALAEQTEDQGLAVARYNELQKNRTPFMDSLTRVYPDLYAVKIMNAFRSPYVPGEMTHIERIDTLKQSFFDHAAIDDPSLLAAPVYTYKLIDYLSLYKDLSLTREEQEISFMEAVDLIMANVSGDSEIRSFVVEFLLEGFEMLNMEQVLMHLADNYLDEACESDVVELVLSRMEGYKKMAAGEQAPDFVLRDVDGKVHQLAHMDHDWILVVFWSSTCEACRKLMPALDAWYRSEKDLDLEVVAISIDTSASNFEYLHQQIDPQWISFHDPLGWHGKVPSDYMVYATPSLFLLDRQRNILSKPTSFRQFSRSIRKLNPPDLSADE